MYEIIQNFIKYNRTGRTLRPQGIVLHETATPGATDEAEQIFFNTGDRKASAHLFIDWDSITQTVPFNEVAWHAGPTANTRFLSAELCHPKTHNPEQFQEVWNRAVWAFANTFKNELHITTITKDNLMSHDEVSKRWHETDHTDPVEFFAEYGKTVDDFRKEVQEAIDMDKSLDEVLSVIKNMYSEAQAGNDKIRMLVCAQLGDRMRTLYGVPQQNQQLIMDLQSQIK